MKKMFKIPSIIEICVFLFSFVYGGIYTEMNQEGLGFNLSNVFVALFGALIIGFVPFFIALIISYIYYKSK